MRFLWFFLVFISSVSYASDINQKQSSCSLEHKTNIKLLGTKTDFFSKKCIADGGNEYLKNYIILDNKEYFISDVSTEIGDNPKVEAVSIYENLLIILTSKTMCCYPQPSGKYYNIYLYKVSEQSGKISFNDITKIFGESSEGFDGISDGKVNYKLKTISDIRNWLKKNYKSDNINLKNINPNIYLSNFKINSLIIDDILNLKKKNDILIYTEKEAFKFFPNLERITEQSDSQKFIFLNIDNIKYAISINSYDLDNGNVSNEYKLINLNRKDFVENLGYWFNISKDKKLQYKDGNGKMKIIKLD